MTPFRGKRTPKRYSLVNADARRRCPDAERFGVQDRSLDLTSRRLLFGFRNEGNVPIRDSRRSALVEERMHVLERESSLLQQMMKLVWKEIPHLMGLFETVDQGIPFEIEHIIVHPDQLLKEHML